MGQALRRAMGRVPGSARTGPSPRPPQNVSCNPEQVPWPPYDGAAAIRERLDASPAEDISETKVESYFLEERDPEYDAMLQNMAGTIRSKTGGKPEMGEAFIVQKSKRPLPKVRSSVDESGRDGQKPLLPGTLTIAQLQEIMLLHQGKAADHKDPMDTQNLSKKFGVDAVQVEQILQFLSLPPEQDKNDKNKSN